MSIMVVNDMLFSARKLTSKVFSHVRGSTLISKACKGFTLIELLVVIGILGVLAAAALVAINPAEAQKKARDTQRLKDMATIQSIAEQYLNDNPGVAVVNASVTSTGAVATVNKCATGWLTAAFNSASLCTYANVLPVDPVNRVTTVTSSAGADVPSKTAVYKLVISNGTYKVCTYLESKSNASKLIGDGETNVTEGDQVFAAFSAPGVACLP